MAGADSDHSARLAAIEVRLDVNEKSQEKLDKKIDANSTKLDKIDTTVSGVRSDIKGMQGFARGAAFAITFLAGTIGAAITALWHRIFDGGGG